ncbi:MAG: metallophosphoesterase [bacterium]
MHSAQSIATHKKSIKFFSFIFLIAAIATVWTAYDSTRLHIKHLIIQNDAFAKILAGKKIVFFSDTHFDKNDQPVVSDIIQKLEKIQPDFIFLAGDLVRWYGMRADYDLVFSFLKKLSAKSGVFSVMGDSDYAFSRISCGFCHENNNWDTTALNQTLFLRDQFFDLNIEGYSLRIAGIDCGPDMLPDLTIADSLCDSNTPTVLLSHTSTVFDAISQKKNVLVLAGDTHGGQMYLPDFAWKIWQRKPDPERMYGLFQEGNKMLYVTSGVGTSDVIFRFGVPAEIVVLEFVPEMKNDKKVSVR